MGYDTNYSDEITIDPPLSWDEIQSIPEFYPEVTRYGYVSRDVKFDVQEERVNTSEGVLIKRSARAIEPLQKDSYKGYYIQEHVQQIVDKFKDTHKFSGYISAKGEEAGDIWRLYVIDGKAQAVEPTITWPEV